MSQKKRVLAYMQQDGGITSAEAFQLLGCTRLSARIFELRKDGHIITERRKRITNRFGESISYSEYKLEKPT